MHLHRHAPSAKSNMAGLRRQTSESGRAVERKGGRDGVSGKVGAANEAKEKWVK